LHKPAGSGVLWESAVRWPLGVAIRDTYGVTNVLQNFSKSERIRARPILIIGPQAKRPFFHHYTIITGKLKYRNCYNGKTVQKRYNEVGKRAMELGRKT
jgi:hypothetical protein